MAQQIEATVLKIGTAPNMLNSIPMSFPTLDITIEEVISASINSCINYQGVKYYVSETQSSLIAEANAGGGSVTIPDTSYADNDTAVAALGTGVLYKSTTLINGSPIILLTV